MRVCLASAKLSRSQSTGEMFPSGDLFLGVVCAINSIVCKLQWRWRETSAESVANAIISANVPSAETR